MKNKAGQVDTGCQRKGESDQQGFPKIVTFEQRPVDGEGRSHTDIGGKIILGTGNGQCSGPEVEGCLELSGTARRPVARAEARGDMGPPCRPRFCVNPGSQSEYKRLLY